jgi:predicted ATPase/DNA-binding SARP family transcriptional activator
MALLAYLAVTNESHSRQSLANLLWPEYDERRARADLRRTLSVLNKILGRKRLVAKREMVSLNPQAGFWLDVNHFHKLLEQCKTHGHPPTAVCAACLTPLTEAVALYHDGFMAGFSLPDSANFDDWQYFQTEQLRSELSHTLERLIHCHYERAEFEVALAYAQQWLGLDGLNEIAHRRLMQLYAHTGQRAAALRQYQLCVGILREELGVTPSAETTALYKQIRAGEQQGLNGPERYNNSLGQIGPLTVQTGSTLAPDHAAPDAATILGATPLLHNLPVQPTPFIGRRSELAEIAARLADPACQLLTLIGPGGIGKTRLALESAARTLPQRLFSDGVYFIPLAPSSQADFLISAIGHALRLSFYGPESFNENPKGQLLNYLRERKMLLVIDNFEYMLSGVDLLVEMLQVAPNLKILVTSRERLNVQAEWVLEIQGMRTPKEHEIETLEEYSVVQLFLQNARRTQADFMLTEEDKPYLIRICQLVGGMPLGIQLASAWVRFLSCKEIAKEIARSLDFLETSLRDVPERHRSLGVVFAHGWNLLSEEERRAYRQLSVFQGGFYRRAAAEVARASLPLLSTLADKSFLHRNAAGRYEMHEVLRQYAAEKLHENPEEEANTRTRHAEYYAAFLEERQEALKNNRQKQAVLEISEEVENVRVSWRWAIANKNVTIIAQSLESLYRFYEMRGWVSEGEAAFAKAVVSLYIPANPQRNLDPQHEFVLGQLMARQGALCSRLGLADKARRLLEKSLTIFRHLEEPIQIAFSLNYLGAVARLQGAYQQARQLWQESLLIYRELGDRWGTAWSLNVMGHMAGELGEYLEARQLLEEGLAIHQEIGNHRGMAGSLNNLGYTLYLLGEYEKAQPLLREALTIRRELGYRRGIAISLNYLGQVADALDKVEEAKTYFYEALKIAMNIQDIPLVLDILVGLARVLVKEGKLEQAGALLYFPLYHPATGQTIRVRAHHLSAELASSTAGPANVPASITTAKARVTTALGATAHTDQLEETVRALLDTQT